MGSIPVWLLASATVACGDNVRLITDASSDSHARPDAGPCWPFDTATPKGTLELGTGSGLFIPMPDEINLHFGDQGGFDIPTRGRITGLDPGNPQNILDPANPRSRYRAFLANGDPAYSGGCPARYGYVSDGAGGDLTPTELQTRFWECMGPADLFDKQFLVRGEVIDDTGGYAMAEKVVTVRAPIGWDAGVSDAVPVDAANCPPHD